MAEYDAIDRPSQSNAGGRKREACDRCHGQKLRCIFKNESLDNSEQSCARCAKAGATCTTRISGRAGRPRLSPLDPLEGQRGNGKGKRKRQRDGTVSSVSSKARESSSYVDNNAEGRRTIFERQSMERESIGDDNEDMSVNPKSTLQPHDASTDSTRPSVNFPTSLWSEETLPPYFNDDTGGALNFIAPGLEYSWVSQEDQAQFAEIQNLTNPAPSPPMNDQLGELEVNGYVSSTHHNSTDARVGGASDELIHVEAPNENTCRAPLNHVKVSNAQMPPIPNQTGEKTAAPFDLAVDPTANLATFMSVAREGNGSWLSEAVGDLHYQRMKKLSEFAVNLHAQLSSIGANKLQHVSVITSTDLRDQLIGGVLKSSIAFRKLLDSLSASTGSPGTSSTPSSANFTTSVYHNNLNGSPSDSGNSSAPSVMSFQKSVVNINERTAHHRRHTTLSTISSDEFDEPFSIDITIILQLVICYIRIVHLHSIMYSRILDYLVTLSREHTQSILPVFPGMQVGGVSLDVFATFQIKLLVQISVHVLGGIEIALGVPERYRIGRGKVGARPLLDSHLSGEFVECLMRENAWRGQNVETVRKHLRDLGEVLESGGWEM